MSEQLPRIIESGDFFIVALLHKFPGAIVSMQFSIKARPGTNELHNDLHAMVSEPILRGTWLIGIDSTCKNGKEINDEAYELSKSIFFTHGVFIQHLIVEESPND